MNIKEIVRIGNEAKNVCGGDYSLPNAAFAVVLNHMLYSQAEFVSILLETNDPSGRESEEAYYDLVVVGDNEGEELCIPLPLLGSIATATVVKRALYFGKYRDRGMHARHVSDSPQILADLWESFFQEVGLDVIRTAQGILSQETTIPDSSIVT